MKLEKLTPQAIKTPKVETVEKKLSIKTLRMKASIRAGSLIKSY